jgi:hypothetical protein
MKQRFRLSIVPIVVMVVVIGCSPPAPKSVAPEPTDGLNLLVAVEGQVRLKRDGWSDYIPVGFGTLIQYDDLLQVDGIATVLCGDLTVETVSGWDSCPCPPSARGRLEHRGTYFRGPSANVPYVQHPRNTLVLDERPLLRWHNTGASAYTVAVVQSGKAIWQQNDVAGSEMQYPEDAPPLRSDVDYLLAVQDSDTGAGSSADPARGIGFQVMAKEDRLAIEDRRKEILGLSSLDEPSREFVLATYYATWGDSEEQDGRGLWGEAWLLLESVAQTYDAPAVYLWMGDLLRAMKLPDEAEAAYQTALQRAETLGDLESQAIAHAGLWWVTGRDEEWDEALLLYEALGDEAQVEALREEKGQ